MIQQSTEPEVNKAPRDDDEELETALSRAKGTIRNIPIIFAFLEWILISAALLYAAREVGTMLLWVLFLISAFSIAAYIQSTGIVVLANILHRKRGLERLMTLLAYLTKPVPRKYRTSVMVAIFWVLYYGLFLSFIWLIIFQLLVAIDQIRGVTN
jgi:hypothetical protein